MRTRTKLTLIDLLRDSKIAVRLSLPEWSLILSEARYFGMLAQLRTICAPVWEQFPKEVKRVIHADTYYFENQNRILGQETLLLTQLLSKAHIKHTYLKGTAYQLLNLEEFEGRLMADIDLLVPHEKLAKTEQLLKQEGWLNSKISDYDDRFYREWSHEIPPLKHLRRGTELDVHFNILPTIIKKSPNPKLLSEHTVQLAELTGASTLRPPALFMHSAIHLFYESEFHKGIRDLYDLKLLAQRFQSSEFWEQVYNLAVQLRQEETLFFAIRYCEQWLGVTFTTEFTAKFAQHAPQRTVLTILDWSFKQAFCRFFPPLQRFGHPLALTILYWRGHLKRMPLSMLIPHIFRKSWRRLSEKEEETMADWFQKEGESS